VAIVMVTSGAAAASAGDPEPTAPTPDVVEATEGSTTLPAPLEEEATDPAADTTSPEEPAPSPEEAAPPAQPEGEGEGVPTPSEPEGGTPVEAQPAPVVAPAAHDDEDEDHDHDGGHDTAVVLVNGQPFRGQGDPKLEGCSITLSIAELEDGAHGVAGSIRAVDPSGDADLVEFETGFSGPSWTQTWELDDLVDGLDRKPNGYRIQISLAIDEGDTLVSRRFWLACGAPQTGSPYVIVIDKQWIDPEGAPLPGPPAELPADWRITASSQLGTALCVYPEGSDELTCEYDNKGGHGGGVGAARRLEQRVGHRHLQATRGLPRPRRWPR
jgi:hypothetical protein